MQEIFDNRSMVENKLFQRNLMEVKDPYGVRIRSGFWGPDGIANVNDRNRVEPGISPRIGVNTQNCFQVHVKTYFFFCFSDGCGFHRFADIADINEASGQCKPTGKILSFNQDNSLQTFVFPAPDNDIYRESWGFNQYRLPPNLTGLEIIET